MLGKKNVSVTKSNPGRFLHPQSEPIVIVISCLIRFQYSELRSHLHSLCIFNSHALKQEHFMFVRFQYNEYITMSKKNASPYLSYCSIQEMALGDHSHLNQCSKRLKCSLCAYKLHMIAHIQLQKNISHYKCKSIILNFT